MHAFDCDALALLKAFSRLSDDAILLLDASGGLRFANAQACRLLGYTNAEEAYEHWGRLRSAFQTAAASFDVKLEGGRAIRAASSALGETDRDGRVVVLSDRRSLEVMEQELVLASRMRSLAYEQRMLAHDLRAPLNAMHLSLELLEAELSDKPASGGAEAPHWERHVGILRSELARLEQWLSSTLDPKSPSPGLDPLDMAAALKDIARLIGVQARRHHTEVELDLRTPAPVAGMREDVRQAVLNVAIDALQAAAPGGRVAIRGDADRPDSRCTVTVEDTRRAMPESALREIERLEWCTRESSIDLYVARRLLEGAGGRFTAERLSTGMRFVLEFPAAPSGRTSGICVA